MESEKETRGGSRTKVPAQQQQQQQPSPEPRRGTSGTGAESALRRMREWEKGRAAHRGSDSERPR